MDSKDELIDKLIDKNTETFRKYLKEKTDNDKLKNENKELKREIRKLRQR